MHCRGGLKLKEIIKARHYCEQFEILEKLKKEDVVTPSEPIA